MVMYVKHNIVLHCVKSFLFSLLFCHLITQLLTLQNRIRDAFFYSAPYVVQWRSKTETLILYQISTFHVLYVRSSVLHLSLLFIYTKNKRYMYFWRSNVFENRCICQSTSKNIKFKTFFQKCFSLMTFVHHLLFIYYIVVQLYPWFKFYLYIINIISSFLCWVVLLPNIHFIYY